MTRVLPLNMQRLGFEAVVEGGQTEVYRWQIGRQMYVDAQALKDGVNDGCWLVRLTVMHHNAASISTDYEDVGGEPVQALQARLWYVLDHGRRELLKDATNESDLRVACLIMAMQGVERAGRSAA